MIPYESLSGGCKAVILMLMTNEIINASSCGDNCVSAIELVLEKKSITIRLGHLLKLSEKMFPVKLIDKDMIVHDWYEFALNAEVI